MNVYLRRIALALTLSVSVLGAAGAQLPDASPRVTAPPATAWTGFAPNRGASKSLSGELATLVRRFTSRGSAPGKNWESDDALYRRFGVRRGDKNPIITLTVVLSTGKGAATEGDMKGVGATVLEKTGGRLRIVMPLRRVPLLGELAGVKRVQAASPAYLPPDPEGVLPRVAPPSRGAAPANPLLFDRQGLTGSGVVVGVIDTGIYWKHPDFIKPDGSSRILALWDPFDDSYNESGGKIGSPGPIKLLDKCVGTVYTQAQLTAALKGKGVVNSPDDVGHGTACASTAASNGRAPGAVQGVAPGADLIVVGIGIPDEKGKRVAGLNGALGVAGAAWAIQEARKRGEPIVLNMSYGSQGTAHDGQTLEELQIDKIVREAKTGVAICVSAGNDGHTGIAAQGWFGPLAAGQRDTEGSQLELLINQPGPVNLYLPASDSWGIKLVALSGPLSGADEKPVSLYLRPNPSREEPEYYYEGKLRFDENELRQILADTVELESRVDDDPAKEKLSVILPPGHYVLQSFGTGPAVRAGRFAAYLPSSRLGHFGIGGTEKYTVGSPGNASSVITVGSYDLLTTWKSDAGDVRYLLQPGELSSFSSAGPRRDGVVKPDLVAPGRYLISSLAPGSEMAASAKKRGNLAVGGQHLGWSGTSASSPYTAGVIALMFQKNPALSSEKVREILTKSARRDRFTMGVPSPDWGYGKLDPVAALKATPAGPARRAKKSSSQK